MRSFLVIGSAILLTTAISAQKPLGVVKSVTATATGETGRFQFTVRGDNPCGAVSIELNDGSEAITYAIERLPYTAVREFERVGTHRVIAKGHGDCIGEVTTEVTVTAVRPRPPRPTPPPPPPARPEPAPAIRFAEMDNDRNRVISRAEWRGSAQSFAFHDWNDDNQLSGDEVRFGAAWPNAATKNPSKITLGDWSEPRFRAIDRNGNDRISRGEWTYDLEDFLRVDRNGDNQLTLNEFLIGDIDDDRGDRFDDLDANQNNRLERREWHGSAAAFEWLDRNNDGVLTRAEAGSNETGGVGGGSVRGGSARGGGGVGPTEKPGAVMVPATREWTDTGITLQAGDLLDISASGQVFYAPGKGAFAPPSGSGRATAAAPMPNMEIGALVGRIGDGRIFFVGETMAGYRAQTAGRLFLRVNDDVLSDNRGEFRAVIAVTRR